MRFCTWKVRSLYRAGSLTSVSSELSRYRLDLVGVQEVRWEGSGTVPAGEYTFFYGKGNENQELVIFLRMVSSGMLRHVALVRTDVSEELSTSFIRVTRIGELGTTLAVTSSRRTLRRNGGAKFLRNEGSYKSHTA
jgi:hypothetical protein